MRILIFCFYSVLLPLGLLAQVGVNTSQPSQALDVNGKIEIGDDEVNPTAGALRFNDPEADFEGYDGNEWKSLTQTKNSDLPGANGRPITAISANISPGETESIEFDSREGNVLLTTPGPGEYFLVTSINVYNNFFDFEARRFVLAFYVSNDPNSGFGDSDNQFRMIGDGSIQNFVTSQTPILIIGPGEYLRVSSSVLSEGTVNMNLRGVWVDGLDH